MLMSSIDSLSGIILGNIKLPSEAEEHIVPFLERIKEAYGVPVALVHDMGKAILSAVAQVFPNVPDLICHFHFLRDIGKDLFGDEYDIIRKRLRKLNISSTLRYRAKQLKQQIDARPELIDMLDDIDSNMQDSSISIDTQQALPILNAYSLILWTLKGQFEGNGYGFPFDHPRLIFAKRIRHLHEKLTILDTIRLRGQSKDNKPYYKIYGHVDAIMDDKILWKAVRSIDEKIAIFEKLRTAMRIASPDTGNGLNDEGKRCNIKTIEDRVKQFRCDIVAKKDYSKNSDLQKMVQQLDKYWEKLFADPIAVETPSGSVLIQPQRTNNILEQFFRSIKRANRRRTGNASSKRMLQTILAETPLVRNLQNPAYMKIILGEKESLEDVFAEIDIDQLRQSFQEAKNFPEKISPKLKKLIDSPDFPERLVNMIKKMVA